MMMNDDNKLEHFKAIAFSEKSAVVLCFYKTSKGWTFRNMNLLGCKSLTNEQVKEIEATKFDELIYLDIIPK